MEAFRTIVCWFFVLFLDHAFKNLGQFFFVVFWFFKESVRIPFVACRRCLFFCVQVSGHTTLRERDRAEGTGLRSRHLLHWSGVVRRRTIESKERVPLRTSLMNLKRCPIDFLLASGRYGHCMRGSVWDAVQCHLAKLRFLCTVLGLEQQNQKGTQGTVPNNSWNGVGICFCRSSRQSGAALVHIPPRHIFGVEWRSKPSERCQKPLHES